MEVWWHAVVHLLSSGKRAAAIDITRKAAGKGSLAAKVRLARFGDEAGINREEVDRIIAEAEQMVRENDPTTHWALSGAYDVGLGSGEYEERSRLVLKHLEAYATISGSPQAAYAVGMNYAIGRVGVQPNEALALDWFYIAAALDQPEAQRIIARQAPPNTSIERASSSKPAATSHVKR